MHIHTRSNVGWETRIYVYMPAHQPDIHTTAYTVWYSLVSSIPWPEDTTSQFQGIHIIQVTPWMPEIRYNF